MKLNDRLQAVQTLNMKTCLARRNEFPLHVELIRSQPFFANGRFCAKQKFEGRLGKGQLAPD